MYNKIVELCGSLNKLTPEELRKEGVEALIIYAINTPEHHVDFIKGEASEVLSMIGSALSYISNASGMHLKTLLNMIYDNETLLEKMRKEKEGE